MANVDPDMMDHPFHLHLTLPSLKAWGFSLLRESLESTELNPDTFPDLKTLYITGLPKGRGLRPMIFGSIPFKSSSIMGNQHLIRHGKIRF
ncbi:MAG: hypothetical protein BRC50_11110 [Cyanobacteria bacterium SW_11_48_12]|nr:MAG: hypothetical protein BRC50_11110 [Cyanobacteria bacterium SW_11_48_12]